MNNKPIVWLLQKPKYPKDFSAVEEHGALEPILDENEHPSAFLTHCYNKIKDKLSGFDEDHDCILSCGGDPLVLILAGVVLRDLGYKEFNWMRWNKPIGSRPGNYASIRVSVNNLNSLKEQIEVGNYAGK